MIETLERFGDDDATTGLSNWQQVELLITQYPYEREAILRWVFRSYPGLCDPRNRAGAELRRTTEDVFWTLIAELLTAEQPYDREYGLEVFDNMMNDQHYRGPYQAEMLQLAQQVLRQDKDLSIHVKAAYCLRVIDPEAVRHILHQLLATPIRTNLSESEQRRETHLRRSAVARFATLTE